MTPPLLAIKAVANAMTRQRLEIHLKASPPSHSAVTAAFVISAGPTIAASKLIYVLNFLSQHRFQWYKKSVSDRNQPYNLKQLDLTLMCMRIMRTTAFGVGGYALGIAISAIGFYNISRMLLWRELQWGPHGLIWHWQEGGGEELQEDLARATDESTSSPH